MGSLDILSATTWDSKAVAAYYTSMGQVYKRYHSRAGAMHLPIKLNDTERHQDKLLFQALTAAELIRENKYKTVVELGCGFGFNTLHLARLFPEVQFIGMDITDSNLKAAREQAGNLPNVHFKRFDFNEAVHPYKADLVFGVETFCYAANISHLLKNIAVSLNPGGRILIFDGYETKETLSEVLNPDQSKAYALLCGGFVLTKFQSLPTVYAAIQNLGLSLELDQDYTSAILPNYKVFQKGCLNVLRFPHVSKLMALLGIIPEAALLQVPSGLFGAYFFEQQWLTYRQLLVRKPE